MSESSTLQRTPQPSQARLEIMPPLPAPLDTPPSSPTSPGTPPPWPVSLDHQMTPSSPSTPEPPSPRTPSPPSTPEPQTPADQVHGTPFILPPVLHQPNAVGGIVHGTPGPAHHAFDGAHGPMPPMPWFGTGQPHTPGMMPMMNGNVEPQARRRLWIEPPASHKHSDSDSDSD